MRRTVYPQIVVTDLGIKTQGWEAHKFHDNKFAFVYIPVEVNDLMHSEFGQKNSNCSWQQIEPWLDNITDYDYIDVRKGEWIQYRNRVAVNKVLPANVTKSYHPNVKTPHPSKNTSRSPFGDGYIAHYGYGLSTNKKQYGKEYQYWLNHGHYSWEQATTNQPSDKPTDNSDNSMLQQFLTDLGNLILKYADKVKQNDLTDFLE